MEPYDPGRDPGELGGVGEGVCPVGGAIPLTAATSDQRSQVSLPLPMGEGLLTIFMKQLTFIPSCLRANRPRSVESHNLTQRHQTTSKPKTPSPVGEEISHLMMRAQARLDAVERCFADGSFVPSICRGGELRELARNG
jgi:hypothetical protein